MKANPVILIVFDGSDSDIKLITSQLLGASPAAWLYLSPHADDAMKQISERKHDILLLDVMLPKSDVDASLALGEEYIYSREVAFRFKEEHPEGVILLVSSYAVQYQEHYPSMSRVLPKEDLRSPEVIRELFEGMGFETQKFIKSVSDAGEEVHYPSRIMQVRRSDWFNGSREGMEDSWSIRTSYKNPHDDEPEKGRKK